VPKQTYFTAVSPNSVANTSGIKRSGNFGGIALNNFVIGIDSGQSFEIGKVFRRKLEEFYNLPVRYFVLTHTHTDHRNGMDAFNDVPIILSKKTIANMPKSVRLGKFLLEEFDRAYIITDDDLEVEVHHVGGYTIGSNVVYFPSEKVLFAGDLLFLGGVNFNIPFLGFYQNKPKKTGNPDEYIDAFEKFISMDIEVLVPGHGCVVFNPKEELNTQLEFIKSLKSFFIEVLEENKALEVIKLPKLDLIVEAYASIEKKPSRESEKRVDKRFLENYLNHLKISFYNHYQYIVDQEI
jgi:glyoxylase-like metal-dependent hydrolase (beta-lactamase superfamily II)